jgi:hypothetical protein
MNATRQFNPYAPVTIAPAIDGEHYCAAQGTTRFALPASSWIPAAGPARGISSRDVSDLIAADGPLSARDIASGLDVSLFEALARVRAMVAGGGLRQDEWGRYHLSGVLADEAA